MRDGIEERREVVGCFGKGWWELLLKLPANRCACAYAHPRTSATSPPRRTYLNPCGHSAPRSHTHPSQPQAADNLASRLPSRPCASELRLGPFPPASSCKHPDLQHHWHSVLAAASNDHGVRPCLQVPNATVPRTETDRTKGLKSHAQQTVKHKDVRERYAKPLMQSSRQAGTAAEVCTTYPVLGCISGTKQHTACESSAGVVTVQINTTPT
jgi:hypothetical protein